MIRQPPRPTLTATPFPYPTLFRSDLAQREPRRLRLPNEAQPAHVLHAVAAHARSTRGRLHQPAALVIAHRLHPDPAGFGQPADRRHHSPLEPHLGTDPR